MLRIAASPVSWGVDFPDSDGVPVPEVLVEQIRALGIDSLELGPRGYFPERRTDLRRLLERNRLQAVGTWLLVELRLEMRKQLATETESTLRFIRAADGRLLILIDAVNPERTRTAGRSSAARRMSEREWSRFVDNLMWVMDRASRCDVQVVFHPHAGTFVEFEDEIVKLLDLTAPAELRLCIDTGHLCYAGISAADLLRRFPDRVGHVHLKDVDGHALARSRRDRLDFWGAVASGLFCPLGTGVAEIEEVVAALVAAGFEGFATIEQDRMPGADLDALRDLRSSAEFVRRLLRRAAR